MSFGYFSLGLLVGVLTGLSSSPIVGALLATLFTFVGGSAAYLLDKRLSDRKLIGTVIGVFSTACLVGLLFGIFVKENRLLTLSHRQENLASFQKRIDESDRSTESYSREPYLKADQFLPLDAVNAKYRAGDFTPQQAYEHLWDEAQKMRQLHNEVEVNRGK